MQENPSWYEGADWDEWTNTFRFSLQANRASAKVVKHLEDNNLIVRSVQNTDTPEEES